jgi:quinoprotein glucose dehydrogenase
MRARRPQMVVRSHPAGFDPDPAFKTWERWSAPRTGGGNVWSVMVTDPERDLVFLPTSSPAPDYYGGMRLGENRYANSIVALRASTGQVVWHFQTSHHDIWDYDNAAPPALTTATSHGAKIPVVIQVPKTGMMRARLHSRSRSLRRSLVGEPRARELASLTQAIYGGYAAVVPRSLLSCGCLGADPEAEAAAAGGSPARCAATGCSPRPRRRARLIVPATSAPPLGRVPR